MWEKGNGARIEVYRIPPKETDIAETETAGKVSKFDSSWPGIGHRSDKETEFREGEGFTFLRGR